MDKRVLFLFSENPEICQQELAERVGVTQPAICLRLKKLKQEGIIKEGRGIDFKALGLKLVLAEGKGDLKTVKKSPYFVAGFETKRGLACIFCGENEGTAKSVPRAMMEQASVRTVESFEGVFGAGLRKKGACRSACGECGFYGECLGLPGTKWYKGELWKHQ